MLNKNEVLLLGYSFKLGGGVSKVTRTVCNHLPYLRPHPVVHCYHPKIKSVLLTAVSFVRFCAILLVHPPRVLHVIVGSNGDLLRTIPFILCGKLRKCWVCLHFHKSLDVIYTFEPGLKKALVRRTWQHVDAFVFISKRLRDEFNRLYGQETNNYIIPNVLEADWLNLRSPSLVDRARDVVFLGRWSSEKGVKDLLTLFSGQYNPEGIKCNVFSDFSPSTPVDHFHFWPWLTGTGVKEVLSDSKILILPSYAEAYPTILLEAAACGTPFIATTIGGIPDIADESQAGLLVKAGDIEGMKSALNQLLYNKSLWAQLSTNGVKWIKNQPSVSEVMEKWEALYKDLSAKQVK